MTSSVAKNTLYLTIASVGQKTLAFVYFIYLARVMQPESTGIYFLAISISTIFSVVADFGVTPVVIREIAKVPEKALSLTRSALGVKLPFLLLGIICANTAAWLLQYDPVVQQLVFLASIVMALDSIHLLYYGVLRGHQTLRFESLGIFMGMLLTVLFGGTVLLFDPGLTLLVSALLIGSSFNFLFSTKQVTRLLGITALIPVWDSKKVKSLLAIALPFFLAGVFVKVYSHVDTLFLSKMIGNEAVGLYSIPYKITYAFQFLPMAFAAALYPGLSRLVKNDQQALARMFNDSMWYMALLSAPIVFGIWAIAPDVVLLAGENYAASGAVLATLIFVLLPIFLDFPIGSLLNAADRQSTKTVIMGITMIINITLNVLFIPEFGVIGAAYSALGSFCFLFFAGLYFVPQIVSGYKISGLFRVVLPIFFSGAVMGLIAFSLRPIIGFILVIPIAAIVYVGMLLTTRSIRVTHLSKALQLFSRKPDLYATTPTHDD